MTEYETIKTNLIQIGKCTEISQLPASKELKIYSTELSGVFVLQNPFNEDDRGAFQEKWRISQIKGISSDTSVELKQGALSMSHPRVIRGIHGEMQYKAITPVLGEFIGAYVDLDSSSPTFLKWIMLKFNIPNIQSPRTTIILKPGMGNSFGILGTSDALYDYTVSEEYKQGNLGVSIKFDDPIIGIPWDKYITNPIISDSRDFILPYAKDVWPKLNNRSD